MTSELRYVNFREKSMEGWRDMSCNSSCFQCLEDDGNQLICKTDNCTEQDGCFFNNMTWPGELKLKFRCEGTSYCLHVGLLTHNYTIIL